MVIYTLLWNLLKPESISFGKLFECIEISLLTIPEMMIVADFQSVDMKLLNQIVMYELFGLQTTECLCEWNNKYIVDSHLCQKFQLLR